MSTKPAFAVVLSGCGVYDGTEIHEAVLTLLAIDSQGGRYACFAPDVAQHHVVNHLTGQESPDKRNVLAESARIARGKIEPLSAFDVNKFDALVFPGGFGAAKNLCSFAFDGPACQVNPDVLKAVKAMHAAGKPIGALCISPVLIARILGAGEVTIGNDAGTAQAIEKMGGKHAVRGHGEVVVDARLKLVTSPCYMLDATISQIAEGADNAIRHLMELMR
ncbi:MAG: isoprenoid biosynthesis protein ElbB [Rhodospirillales bacterium]|nr:MAG: isoprenoid biosynthesis protein ElbB [Rhodospirillales bacterium]